jgi:hypothetical protein
MIEGGVIRMADCLDQVDYAIVVGKVRHLAGLMIYQGLSEERTMERGSCVASDEVVVV